MIVIIARALYGVIARDVAIKMEKQRAKSTSRFWRAGLRVFSLYYYSCFGCLTTRIRFCRLPKLRQWNPRPTEMALLSLQDLGLTSVFTEGLYTIRPSSCSAGSNRLVPPVKTLQSAVAPSRSPLANSGTALIAWRRHSGWFIHRPFPFLPEWFYGLSDHLMFLFAQRLDFFAWCVRLSRL